MTPLLAATATALADVPPWLILAAAAVVAAPGYALSCWVWPFARCWRCDGRGRFARKDGRVWRPCGRCKGSGRRLRVGRAIYNRLARVRRDAS